MDSFGLLCLLPIILCFVLVFVYKNVFISIFAGIISGSLIIASRGDYYAGLNAFKNVVTSVSIMEIILFILIIGALINALNNSGGVDGLIVFFNKKRMKSNSKVKVQLFTMFIGLLLFVDATSSMAIIGVIGRPLFKNANIPKEKLALIANSTASPIAWLIPFGGAGAMVTGLLMQMDATKEYAFDYVIKAIPFQFYTFSLLFILVTTIIFNVDIGKIKHIKVENEIKNLNIENNELDKARNMIVPLVVLVSGVFTGLFISGNGNVLRGNGADSVFISGVFTLCFSMFFYKYQKLGSIKVIFNWYYIGAKKMFPIVLLLISAFAFSNLIKMLGTVDYFVGISNLVSIKYLPVIVFLLGALISFSTGTSSGAVAILIPLIIPIVIAGGGSIELTLGAIISGAVFGDQNSMISDSVILTSSVTDVDVVTHVSTQLPYTCLAFIVAMCMYLLFGIV